MSHLSEIVFHVPPECGGQIVQMSYGADEQHIYCCRYDQSDQTVQIVAYQHSEHDFDPWNGKPQVGKRVGIIYDGPRNKSPLAI